MGSWAFDFLINTVIPVLVAAAFNNFATKNPLKFDTYAALILGRLLKYTVNRNLVIFYCLFSRLLKLGGSYHAAAFNTGITVYILEIYAMVVISFLY